MSAPLTPSEQRKRFSAFARQLEAGLPITPEQLEWLKRTFLALSDANRDAIRVLGLHYSAGHSAKNEEAARKMDFLIHWIACAISDDSSHLVDQNDATPPLSLEAAFNEASLIAKRLFELDPNSERYGVEYIRKRWYAAEDSRRKSLYRDPSDPNSYYEFPLWV